MISFDPRKSPGLFPRDGFFARAILNKTITREHNGPIKLVGQTTMAPSDHHRAYDKLAEGGKLSAQGGIHGWISETQTDVSAVGIRIFDLEGNDKRRVDSQTY
jgi:hypothetical protein